MRSSKCNDWDAAIHVIKTLRANGHVALLAGGCVRDRLLGIEPKDHDVATDATPGRVAELFPRAKKVGAKFGVIIVRKYGHEVEVATFRSDGEYRDGRHPDEITFGTDKEDAFRRDFTINGLFLDPTENRVIDYVGGKTDIENRLLRTIGDPDQRFSEDHLRMLRAVRFAARLGFQIDADTFSAIKQLAEKLSVISAERVFMELNAILTAPSRAMGWKLLLDTGLRRYLSPTWTVDDREDEHAMRRLELSAPGPIDSTLAFAALLCERNPSLVENICRSLRVSNRLNRSIVWLVRSLLLVRDGAKLELADLKLLMAQDDWPNLLELVRIDLLSSEAPLDLYSALRDRASSVKADDISPPRLVTGDDLTKLGVTPGQQFGDLLETVYRAQLNEEIRTSEQALALLRKIRGSGS